MPILLFPTPLYHDRPQTNGISKELLLNLKGRCLYNVYTCSSPSFAFVQFPCSEYHLIWCTDGQEPDMSCNHRKGLGSYTNLHFTKLKNFKNGKSTKLTLNISWNSKTTTHFPALLSLSRFERALERIVFWIFQQIWGI